MHVFFRVFPCHLHCTVMYMQKIYSKKKKFMFMFMSIWSKYKRGIKSRSLYQKLYVQILFEQVVLTRVADVCSEMNI